MNEVEKWIKKTKAKGPFYLYAIELVISVSTSNKNDRKYYVIWNEKNKTKYGCFEDGMWCRYGIKTISVLSGDSMLDMWNGSAIDEDIFENMVKVRNLETTLPIFNLDDLKIGGW